MTWVEVVLSFVIGIASGIVSSVLVTLHYRRKDAERDRQNFFSDLRRYIGGLISIDADNIDAMQEYLSAHETPKTFPWIKLTNDEDSVFVDFLTAISDLQDVLIQYSSEFSDLLDKIMEQEDRPQISPDDVKEALREKYLHPVFSARVQILQMSLKIQALGNKTLQETMKSVEKES